jgi:hypothetical protein
MDIHTRKGTTHCIPPSRTFFLVLYDEGSFNKLFVILAFRREVDNCALLVQRVIVIYCRYFGSTYRSNLSKVKKKKPMSSPETSVMVLRIS